MLFRSRLNNTRWTCTFSICTEDAAGSKTGPIFTSSCLTVARVSRILFNDLREVFLPNLGFSFLHELPYPLHDLIRPLLDLH